jgi:uncharacterized protein YqeY
MLQGKRKVKVQLVRDRKQGFGLVLDCSSSSAAVPTSPPQNLPQNGGGGSMPGGGNINSNIPRAAIRVWIDRVVQGSPAARVEPALVQGDVVVELNGRDITQFGSLDQVTRLMSVDVVHVTVMRTIGGGINAKEVHQVQSINSTILYTVLTKEVHQVQSINSTILYTVLTKEVHQVQSMNSAILYTVLTKEVHQRNLHQQRLDREADRRLREAAGHDRYSTMHSAQCTRYSLTAGHDRSRETSAPSSPTAEPGCIDARNIGSSPMALKQVLTTIGQSIH